MNRSQETRNNLLRSELKSEFSKEASLYFLSCLVSSVNELNPGLGLLVVKDDAVFSRLSFLCKKVIKDYNVTLESDKIIDFSKIYGYFVGKSYDNLSKMNEFVVKDDVYKSAVRSFFEISGHISAPDSNDRYIEIYFKDENVAKSYGLLLDRTKISYGISKRRNNFVLYIKKFESISDYLAVIGDMSDAINFQVSKAEIEMNTQIQRTYNLDLASIDKTRKNAHNEVLLINNLYKKIGKSCVPENLIQLCELRLNNPESSYEELGDLHVPSISKATVSLKFKKIKNLL